MLLKKFDELTHFKWIPWISVISPNHPAWRVVLVTPSPSPMTARTLGNPDGNSLNLVQSCWLNKLHSRRNIDVGLPENSQRASRIGGLSESLIADFVDESEKTSEFSILNEYTFHVVPIHVFALCLCLCECRRGKPILPSKAARDIPEVRNRWPIDLYTHPGAYGRMS
jgi:hypothetical protein